LRLRRWRLEAWCLAPLVFFWAGRATAKLTLNASKALKTISLLTARCKNHLTLEIDGLNGPARLKDALA
jgi:hypothetical protein